MNSHISIVMHSILPVGDRTENWPATHFGSWPSVGERYCLSSGPSSSEEQGPDLHRWRLHVLKMKLEETYTETGRTTKLRPERQWQPRRCGEVYFVLTAQIHTPPQHFHPGPSGHGCGFCFKKKEKRSLIKIKCAFSPPLDRAGWTVPSYFWAFRHNRWRVNKQPRAGRSGHMETATRGQLTVGKTDLLGSRLAALIASSGITQSDSSLRNVSQFYQDGDQLSADQYFNHQLRPNCAEATVSTFLSC